MRTMVKSAALFVMLIILHARANGQSGDQGNPQQSAELNCRGTLGDVPAVVLGIRQYASYNAAGDGYVKFTGNVSGGGISGDITYEGYTRTAPFHGVITTSRGILEIGVLDNTGGQMLIYGGTPRLGPPETIGRFVCSWL